MKKVILFSATWVFVILTTYIVLNYSGAMVENQASLNISDSPNLISFVPADQFSIKQGESHDAAFVVTSNIGVGLSYRLEYYHPGFTLIPSSGSLTPGQSETITLWVSDSSSVGLQYLDVYLYADYDGGSASLHTTLSVQVEEK